MVIGLAAVASAHAAWLSAKAAEKSIEEMQTTRRLQFVPMVGPEPFVASMLDSGEARITIRNFDEQNSVPAIVHLWELDTAPDGSRTIRASTHRQNAGVANLSAGGLTTVTIGRAKLTEEMSREAGNEALSLFHSWRQGGPDGALVAIYIVTKVGPNTLTFDCQMEVDSPALPLTTPE